MLQKTTVWLATILIMLAAAPALAKEPAQPLSSKARAAALEKSRKLEAQEKSQSDAREKIKLAEERKKKAKLAEEQKNKIKLAEEQKKQEALRTRSDTSSDRAKQALQQAEQRRKEAEQRREIGNTSTDIPGLVGGVRAGQGTTQTQREKPDANALREQYRDRFPIAPEEAKESPFARKDPTKARQDALEQARKRATGGLPEESLKLPDPMDRTLPGRANIPGTGAGQVEGLKGITSRIPGSGQRTNPYDAASIADGKRPFFNLQHQAGGEGMWRCVKYCSENGFQEGELTDTKGVPDNAVRNDVDDMTTTEKLCQEDPKLCEDAGKSKRRPGESDEEYWDRRAKEAYAARKEREREKTQKQADADCSKKASRTERESCEFDKRMAEQELERQRKEEEERRKKAEKDKDKQKDCAVASGEDCDGLPDDALVDWHRATQQRLLGATGAGHNAGPGNVDPERGPAWHAGLEERAVEILGVGDPPEDEGVTSGNAPSDADCATQPGSGAIDYGPGHQGAAGNPGCKTDVPEFDPGETLNLDDAQDDDDDEK
jgi:hypothetical protein